MGIKVLEDVLQSWERLVIVVLIIIQFRNAGTLFDVIDSQFLKL